MTEIKLCVCFCCELRVIVAPSQEVVFVCVLVEQFDLQILPRVVINQALETKIGARFKLKQSEKNARESETNCALNVKQHIVGLFVCFFHSNY